MFPSAMKAATPIERVCALWCGTVRPYRVVVSDDGRQPTLYGDGFSREWHFIVGRNWLNTPYPGAILRKWERDVALAREWEERYYGWTKRAGRKMVGC